MSLLGTVDKICQHLPEGWKVNLCMEHGAAWVECFNPDGTAVLLPDSADRTIRGQLNDAICAATSFTYIY